MPNLITKNDIEEILGYTLTDYGYKSLAERINDIREGKDFKIVRGSGRTITHMAATVLNGILPRNIIFEGIVKEERKMDLDDDELKATLGYSNENVQAPDVRRFKKRYKNIRVSLQR